MPYHKLATDGPIVLTVTSAKLVKGPNPKFPPQLVLVGSDGRRDNVSVPLSLLGAAKQFSMKGAGAPDISQCPLDVEMPEYYGTWKLEMATLPDGGKVTRVEGVADADWERIPDDPNSFPKALQDNDGLLPWEEAPEPQQRPAAPPRAAQPARQLQPRLAPAPQAPAVQKQTDYAALAQASYDRHLGFAIATANHVAEQGMACPDLNSIVATLMIDTLKREQGR
jgi:hypothetical protein